MTLTVILTALAVFLLTVLAETLLIPVLRSHKLGQKILDIGPSWHKSKEGTPIMGGLGFLLATLIAATVFFVIRGFRGDAGKFAPLAATLGFAVSNGAIGFIDDYCKLVKKQNEGLTWKQKLVLQLAVSAGFVGVLATFGKLDPILHFPWGDWNPGVFFYPIAVLFLCGIVNGSNLTDGIDGLESAVTFVIGAFFTVVSLVAGSEQGSFSGAVLMGAAAGFFLFNHHPAKVFMGDTGSLFFGGLVIGSVFLMGQTVAGLAVCGVYIFEMLSSLLQVVYFKLTKGKRLFRMAPFHHHLEKCGWSENRIVGFFFGLEILFCLAGWRLWVF